MDPFQDNPWASVYQRNYSAIPKKEDGKKRFWEQSQLVDGKYIFHYVF